MMRLLWKFFWRERELKRQIAHLIFGLFYALGYLLGLITPGTSILLLIAVVIMSMFLKKRRRFWDRIVLMLERENHLFDIPLRGLIFYIIGTTLTIALFEFEAALAGILTLAAADSIGTLYGKYTGRLKIWWNHDKHAEGPLLGGLLAALLCMSFLPVGVALAAGYSGAFVDTLKMKWGKWELDDNLIIPLVAASIVSLF